MGQAGLTEEMVERSIKTSREIPEPDPKDTKGPVSQGTEATEDIPFRQKPDIGQTEGKAFQSEIIERIEKAIEQNTAKKDTADMVIRIKVNEGETIRLGLKNIGDRIQVDIKTGNETLLGMLQLNKETISRNLEQKNIYTHIYIDPDTDGGFERREERKEGRRQKLHRERGEGFKEQLKIDL
jgi:hypothetical protein